MHTSQDFSSAFARIFSDARSEGGARPGGGQTDVVMSWIDSVVGPLVIGARPEGLCLLEFTDEQRLRTQIEAMRRCFRCGVAPGESPYFAQLREELDAYFAGRLRQFSVPLVAPGTPFQERVWAELLKIPYGETRSYEDLANSLSTPHGQRAVGRANGTNRLAIVIPCHRVINKDGGLGGYGGLLWRKQLLLRLEGGTPASLLDFADSAS